MAGSLSDYWKKRDFKVTSEPRGTVASSGKQLAFVIQKHAASRLHYDFRLELDGTLKSWAVPKGPSYDPAVKRMAVQVEDHPLSYGTFEGTIPKGEYGAGTVVLWDRGWWEPVGDARKGYGDGRLKFVLHGEKLRGHWTLIRMKQREGEKQVAWLLIKEHDGEERPASEFDVTEALPDSVNKSRSHSPEGGNPDKDTGTRKRKAPSRPGLAVRGNDAAIPAAAKKSKLPLILSPQLATLVDAVPAGTGWTWEVKFDGYRLVARIEGDDVRLFTRNGNDWTSRLQTLRDEVASLGIGSAWLDGEIVALDAHGNPSFQQLQNAFDSAKTTQIAYYVFDLPHFGGYDLTRVPLAERRALLAQVFAKASAPLVRFSESFDAPVQQLLESACSKGLEGLIGKRDDSSYVSARSGAWVKLKCTRRQEFVVAGYTDPRGSRVGFGSLLLGVHDAEGKLVYAGNVGTGFDNAGLQELFAKLQALDTTKSPFPVPPKGVKGHWVKPKLVAEIAFTEWTSEGRIRHPVFHGLRTDKEPRGITRETEKHMAAAKKAPKTTKTATKTTAKKASLSTVKKQGDAEVAGIRVSNPERVIDASSGITKLELVQFYDRIAEHLLPHLTKRPVALVRAPGGIGGELFFQKHADRLHIEGLVNLPKSMWPGHPEMIALESRAGIVSAAQMNVVELHTWNSTTDDIAHPDRVIFDLDPGEGITWPMLQEAAQLTHKMLEMLGLESFLKTSGGKGLHVVVPLTPKGTYDVVKDFSESLVQHMARTLPQLFVAKSGGKNRVGRIFIDYLRNGTGATTASAFSARARPGLGVSVPVAWRELKSLTGGDQWNVRTVFDRLKRQRIDPWKEYPRVRQTTVSAAKKLAAVTQPPQG